MADLTVYTYDNVEAVAAVLNGVASIMGGAASNYRDMVKTLGMLGFLVAIASFLVNPTRIAAFSWIAGYAFVYFLMFLPVTRVNIVDVTRPAAGRTINNVPAALALTASLSSTVGFKLTETFETVMQVLPISLGDGTSADTTCSNAPESECMFRFSRGGMMFGNKLMMRIEKASRESPAAVDPQLETDMNEFLSQCTAFDLKQGVVDYAVLSKSTNLWSVLSVTSPARYVQENGVLKDCRTAYNNLSARRNTMGERLVTLIAREAFPGLPDATARSRLNMSAKDVANATRMGDASWQVKDFILQNALINQTKRGLGRMGLESGSASAVMLGYAEASTFSATNATFITQSRLAEEALPLIRNGIETLLYGLFPVAVLVLMAMHGPSLVTAIKGFVFAFVWIQLWPPLYALVNYIGQVRSMQSLRMIIDSMRGAPADQVGVAFANYNNIYNGQISDQAVMGYLIVAVPVIASGVIYGMNSAMGSLSGGGFMTSAGRAGEGAGTGTVSAGNVSLGQQTLGASRVDADVFTNTSTAGTFKNHAVTGGYLAGSLNKTDAPFKITMSEQDVSSAKNSLSASIAATESQSVALSNSVDAAFTKLMSSSTQAQAMAQSMFGYTVSGSASSTAGAGSSGSVDKSGGRAGEVMDSSRYVSTAGSTSGSGVDAGAGGFGARVAIKGGTSRSDAASTDFAQGRGFNYSETGRQSLSTDQQLQVMTAYGKSQGFSEGKGLTIVGADGKQMSYSEAAQMNESLQRELATKRESAASLESLQANKVTGEVDITSIAAERVARDKGGDYLQGLSSEAQRSVLTQYGQVVMQEMGVDAGRSERVANPFRESRNPSDLMVDAQGVTAESVGMNAKTQTDLRTPDELRNEHQRGIFNSQANPRNFQVDRSAALSVGAGMANVASGVVGREVTVNSDAQTLYKNARGNNVAAEKALEKVDENVKDDGGIIGTVKAVAEPISDTLNLRSAKDNDRDERDNILGSLRN